MCPVVVLGVIAALTRYLRACGFGFTFTFFPLDESAAMA